MNTPNAKPTEKKEDFTEKQIKRLTLVAKGLTYKEIAYLEQVSESAIKGSIKGIKNKLGAKNMKEAIVMGIRNSICEIISISCSEEISLTKKQKEVILLAASGKTQQEVSKDLNISNNAVKLRQESVVRNMGAENFIHAIAMYYILFKGNE